MPGPAVDQKVIMPAGDTRTLRFPIYDDTGAAPNLSGASAYWWLGKSQASTGADVVLKKHTPSPLTLTIETIGGVSVYVAYVPIVPADTASLPPGTYYHELRIITAAGVVGEASRGPFVLESAITPTV